MIGAPPRRRIQVHAVQPREARANPLARDLHRVVEAHRLVGIIAAHQLDDLPFSQIDGRNRKHHHMDWRNDWMNRTPGAELFSGWNCTPRVRAVRTAAGKRSPPCDDHAVTTAASVGRHTKLFA